MSAEITPNTVQSDDISYVNFEQALIPQDEPEKDSQVTSLVVSESVISTEDQIEQGNIAKKWLTRGALGALVVGGAFTLASSSMDDLKSDVVEAAPWVAGGILVSESLWIGGAALSLTAAGKRIKVGRGFKTDFKTQMAEVTDDVLTSKAFKTGLYANTIGAVGTATIIGVAAVTKLPPETWPGALGLASLDIAGTVALRAPLYKGVKSRASSQEKNNQPVSVRKAELSDMERLAEIDLSSFESSYGDDLPAKEEVVEMLTKRWHNASGWMFVAEKGGQVEGFTTAFRTNKSAENFISWEESTNKGTLEGSVNADGKYVYVANLTINRDADVKGAKDMLLANLFANAIKVGGIEYGYFESRMPGFQEWVSQESKVYETEADLQSLANEYFETRREDGKRADWQLRMYEGDGFKLGNPVANAFDDEASLGFGVVCKAAVPGSNSEFMKKVAPARWVLASTLRQVAKSPKLLEKVL